MSSLHNFCEFGFFGEADDLEVTAMRAHDQRSRLVKRVFVIGDADFVRRADLGEFRARLFHHIWHAKAAADLDELRTRNDDSLFVRQRGQHKQNC